MSNHRDRREFWLAHWQRCRELGMTLKDYARQEGLTVSVFYGCSKRFKREAKASSPFTRVTVVPQTLAEYRLCFPNERADNISVGPRAEKLPACISARVFALRGIPGFRHWPLHRSVTRRMDRKESCN